MLNMTRGFDGSLQEVDRPAACSEARTFGLINHDINRGIRYKHDTSDGQATWMIKQVFSRLRPEAESATPLAATAAAAAARTPVFVEFGSKDGEF